MYTRDDFFALQCTINNLLLLKIAYDGGLNMEIFKDDYVITDFGVDPSWDLFLTAIDELFEIVEVFNPYEDDKDEQSEKKYWLNLAGYEHHYLSSGVIVILDDRIKPFRTRSLGGSYNNFFSTGYGELTYTENGIIFYYDEDDGSVDFTDALYIIIGILKSYSEGEDCDEVAI